MKPESVSSISVLFTKPKTIQSADDVIDYINYSINSNPTGLDHRNYLIYAQHENYVVVLFEKDMILDEEYIVHFPEKIGSYERSISVNADGLLEIDYSL